ncbi:hypothetical protein VS28_18830 [Vibrio cholerae O1 biovar El Tor]|nr:hypothetical protein VS28_18830 [Vibrio cholerae O1 biovar El Tor]
MRRIGDFARSSGSPFAAGEDMTEVRLVAEPTFQADLRQAQRGADDQFLGALDALLAYPLLGRQPRGAFECAGKMAARQGAGLGEVGDCQAFAKVGEDQLLGDTFASGGRGHRWRISVEHSAQVGP